ncbi:hypothetical protein APU02_13825 [Citrobacter sp. 50677481]|nr:hypothetical protein APU02_13825 [Citrobacter sp. 50677481]
MKPFQKFRKNKSVIILWVVIIGEGNMMTVHPHIIIVIITTARVRPLVKALIQSTERQSGKGNV